MINIYFTVISATILLFVGQQCVASGYHPDYGDGIVINKKDIYYKFPWQNCDKDFYSVGGYSCVKLLPDSPYYGLYQRARNKKENPGQYTNRKKDKVEQIIKFP